MKKSKVIKIVKMDKKDDYGNTSFIIEFENGDKGYYRSKNEDQKKFIVEQEAEYLIEEKTGKNNSKYFKITTPQTERQRRSPKHCNQEEEYQHLITWLISPQVNAFKFVAYYLRVKPYSTSVGCKGQQHDN